MFGSCQKELRTPDYTEYLHVVKKGMFEMYIPPYLFPDRTVSDDVAVAYRDSLRNAFITVFREPVPDTEEDSIEISLEEYATYTAQAVYRKLQDAEPKRSDTTAINGYPAITQRFSGGLDTLQVWYCLTVCKTEYYFFQISAWTLREYADTKGLELYDAICSFKPYR